MRLDPNTAAYLEHDFASMRERYRGGPSWNASVDADRDTLNSRPAGFVPGDELGVLFDVEGLATSSYGNKAWRLLCSAVHPSELQPYCYFFLGDAEIPVGSRPYSFCIGIGVDPAVSNDARPLEVFARKFWDLNDPTLAPRPQRFIRGSELRQTHSLVRCMSLLNDRITVPDMTAFGNLLRIAEEEGWGRQVEATPPPTRRSKATGILSRLFGGGQEPLDDDWREEAIRALNLSSADPGDWDFERELPRKHLLKKRCRSSVGNLPIDGEDPKTGRRHCDMVGQEGFLVIGLEGPQNVRIRFDDGYEASIHACFCEIID